MSAKDPVVSFEYAVATMDGCAQVCRYSVDGDRAEERIREDWCPMEPLGHPIQATLSTSYQSGKTFKIDVDGDEHRHLHDTGRFEKLLTSIIRGNMPGEALKRQLTKAYDLPRLPKIKRPKFA